MSEHVDDRVDDYLHGLLDSATAMALDWHISACEQCRAALELGRQRFEALKATRPETAEPEKLIESTLNLTAAPEVLDKQGLDQIPSNYYERLVPEQSEKARWRVFSRIPRWAKRAYFGGVAAAVLVLGFLNYHYEHLAASPQNLEIYGQSQLMPATDGSLRVRLMEGDRPMRGVPVEIEIANSQGNQFVKLASFETDENGTGSPRFRVPDWPDGMYKLRISAQHRQGKEVVERPLNLKRSAKVLLSTDKPIYQPAQVIRIRSLALRRPDLKPVAGQAALIMVTDPKNNLIFKKETITSRFGIVAAECELSDEILEGTYTIAANIGNAESKLAVEVRPYVLPKFRVDVTLDKSFYKPGQAIKGTIKAAYFHGKPVADGEVRLQLEPRTLGERRFKTDANGLAEFEVRLPNRLPVGGDETNPTVVLQFQVTDTAGQQHARSVSRPIAQSDPEVEGMPGWNRQMPWALARTPSGDFRIEAVPEEKHLVPGVTNRIYFLVTTPTGEPASVRLGISAMPRELQTDELGVAVLDYDGDETDFDRVVQVEDAAGNSAARRIRFAHSDRVDDFLLRTDKAAYAGGDTMKLTALGASGVVFIDFMKDAQTIRTETVNVVDGKGELEVDLPLEWSGTLQLCGFRIDSQIGLSKTHVIFINPASQVSVRGTIFAPVSTPLLACTGGLGSSGARLHQPGEKARLELSLSDEKGQPVPGAISLTGVDEAVFHVSDNKTRDNKKFSSADERALKSVDGKLEWAPGAGRDASRERFDAAMLSKAAQTDYHRGFTRIQDGPDRTSTFSSMFRDDWHSLVGESFSAKDDAVRRLREMWHFYVKGGLVVILLSVGVLLSIYMWMASSPFKFVFFMLLSFLVCVVSITTLGSNANNTFSNVAARATVRWAPQIQNEPAASDNSDSVSQSSIRVRNSFPETLIWKPELITDDQGRLVFDLDLADSITSWRLSASAVTGEGKLGSWDADLRVFQDFFVDVNLPVSLTRNDEVSIPVVVSNYLKQKQTVRLELSKADWFVLTGSSTRDVELAPGEVKAEFFRVKVIKVGVHSLKVVGRAGNTADAVERPVTVLSDGQKVEAVFNGTLQSPVDIALDLPENAIDGSAKAILKLYPSTFTQLTEGLDGIFQMPHGCFEQTSSTTYPNVLALDYLRAAGKKMPETEAKAERFIHFGYQRLLSFEVSGGGFDWFGRSPADATLTAYGLMEFRDMARVYPVDPDLIRRTRRWLLSKRDSDGSWAPTHWGPGHHGADPNEARLQTTAYIAWAVFNGDADDAEVAQRTRSYLQRFSPSTIDNPYVVALLANAMMATDAHSALYLSRLEEMKQETPDGKYVYWGMKGDSRTAFHGTGRSGDVEATALATLAMLRDPSHTGTARKALAWLAKERDGHGTWYSTQATVLALKALAAGAAPAEMDRQIEIRSGDRLIQTILIPAAQSDVMRQIDITPELRKGATNLTLTDLTQAATSYQIMFRHFVPHGERPKPPASLGIQLVYDRTEVALDGSTNVVATVTNRTQRGLPMVMVELPAPAGFSALTEDFDKLLKDGVIDKHQLKGDRVLVYLRGLAANERLELKYRLRAVLTVKVQAAGAKVYEYYDPDKMAMSKPEALVVK